MYRHLATSKHLTKQFDALLARFLEKETDNNPELYTKYKLEECEKKSKGLARRIKGLQVCPVSSQARNRFCAKVNGLILADPDTLREWGQQCIPHASPSGW